MMRLRQCRACHKTTELPAEKCSHCDSTISFEQPKRAHGIEVFPSGYFRDIADEPIYIKGKADLRNETRSRRRS